MCIKVDTNNIDRTSFENVFTILAHIVEYFALLSCVNHFKIFHHNACHEQMNVTYLLKKVGNLPFVIVLVVTHVSSSNVLHASLW